MLAAQIADRRLGLKDELGSAYDFGTRPRLPGRYAAAQISEAAERAGKLRASEAVPLRFPRKLLVFLGQTAAAACLALLPFFPTPERAVAAAPPPTIDGMHVDYDELAGYNGFLREVHQDALDEDLDEVAAAAEEFNELLQDLADERLPYRDALERIADLEQKLAEERWAPDPEVEDYFKAVGRDLARTKLMNKVGEALREQDLQQARDEVRQLAAQTKVEPPDPRRLEELRRAVEQAAKRETPDIDKQMKQLEERQRRLKQKKQGETSERQKTRLKRDKRELERLSRDVERQRARQRQLERLSRDLQQLGESPNIEAGDDLQQLLEQLGEDINQMAREQTTDEQMRELRQRLEELRRLLQQLQRGGKGFKLRLGQFNEGAGGKCQGGGGKVLDLQPGGKGGIGLLRKKAGGDGQASGKQGGGEDRPGGNPGDGIGTSHDPNTMGDPTKIKAEYTDVQATPQQGEGPSRAEVIRTAAEQGFAVRGYGKVHEAFESHAESLLEQEEVPPGYRRYIRQYFERIRPR
jgi:hypothetical protein